VIVQLGAMACPAESDTRFIDDWTVPDVVDSVGITAIEWEGGPLVLRCTPNYQTISRSGKHQAEPMRSTSCGDGRTAAEVADLIARRVGRGCEAKPRVRSG
jgi:hypothetical protein